MILYADASALVKRYVTETGSDLVGRWIAEADAVVCSRIGFVEVFRAVMLAGLSDADLVRGRFERDWESISVVEVQEPIALRAALLATSLGLRSLDAIHLASAESVQGNDLRLASWDRRLWRAARFNGIEVLPETQP